MHKVGTILGEFWRNIWWKITEALVTKLNIYLEEDFQGIILRNEVQIHPDLIPFPWLGVWVVKTSKLVSSFHRQTHK